MKVVRLKPENLRVVENFVNEVCDELNVQFIEVPITKFRREVQKGVKWKYEEFVSPIYHSRSVGFNLSFIPFSGDSVELWKINVESRGKGYGSELLSKIMDVSDRTGIKIKLIPVDYDTDENSPKNYLQKLKEWYMEMGFQRPKFPSVDPYYTYFPTNEYKMVG